MFSRSRYLPSGLVALAALSCGCAPKLESSGTLSVDGADFRPVTCHTFSDATGIELSDASGARLTITIAPAQLEAFKDLSGDVTAKLERQGNESVILTSCGTLALHGEGYHGAGKRAATGKLSLACTAPVAARADLTFSGCF